MNNSKPRNRRRRVLADLRLQGQLCLRVIAYFMMCQFAVIGTMYGFSFLEGASSEGIIRFVVPAMLVSTFLLPVALLDMLIFSNRFAGPMYNFRRKLRDLNENGNMEPIRFRDGDFYLEIRDEFNEILKRIEKHSQEQEWSPDVSQPGKVIPAVTLFPPSTAVTATK